MSWNVFQQSHHQCHCPPTSHIEQWMGPMLKSLQLVPMHRNLTWLDKTCDFTVWEGFKAQGCMSCTHNVWDHPHFHQCSSCSLFVIFFETLLKCHETSSNKWSHHLFHHPSMPTLSSEWVQRCDSFNLGLYVSKFDMVRWDMRLYGLGGFQGSSMHVVSALYLWSSMFSSMIIMQSHYHHSPFPTNAIIHRWCMLSGEWG